MSTHLRHVFRPARRRRGVALIFALIAIALLTVTVLAFFSRAVLNHQISFSSTNQVRANLLAQAALNVITGEVRQEMLNGSVASNAGTGAYPTILNPNTTSDAVPKRVGYDGSTSGLLIAKVSANNAGIYPAGRTLGSSSLVSTPSANGRSISPTAWFGTSYGPNLGSQSTLPTWALVTRNNGIKVPTIANAKQATSDDFVIGRFAYTVYDIGGLLNANVAGSPSVSAPDAAYKSSQAHADLNAVGITDPSTLLSWRNGTDAASESAYSAYLQTYAEPSGFLSTKEGDNAFLSRHDLINYTQLSGGGIPAADATYFTHFSSSLNAPAWGPTANAPAGGAFNYLSNANTAPYPNRFIPNVRYAPANGTGTLALTHYTDSGLAQTYSVRVGDPLIQRRFSLAKLAWLTTNGPATGVSDAATRACFGLHWDPTTPGWIYVGSTSATSTSPLSGISTLDQVATEATPREPNFFELLQAGVLAGALGMNNEGYTGGVGTNTFPYSFQASSFLQLLTLGANIVDQYKSDAYPTCIIGEWGAKAVPITGTKALPMFESYTETAGKDPANGNMASYLVVVLWNPSRSGSAPTSVPNVRLHLHGGYSLDYDWDDDYAPGPPYLHAGTLDQWAQLNPGSYSSFNTKEPLQTSLISTASASWGPLPVGCSTIYPHVSGCAFPELTPDATLAHDHQVYLNKQAAGDEYAYNLKTQLGLPGEGFVFAMEYQASNGNWIPYSFSTGINDSDTWRQGESHDTTNASIVAISDVPENGTGVPGWTGAYPNLDSGSIHDYKVDPRSTRFNEIQSDGYSMFTTLAQQGSAATSDQLLPNLFANDSYFPPGSWVPSALAFNAVTPGSTASTTQNSYLDNDGVLRLADYGLFVTSTTTPFSLYPYTYTANTPYGPFSAGNNPNTTGKNYPIVLNRPFKSVGEMGYAFTDLPWKSINFFDKNSAYGALLDLFSLTDEPLVVADRSNLDGLTPAVGTIKAPVLQAYLSGAGTVYDGSSPLSLSVAGNIANTFDSYAYSGTSPTSVLPLTPAQLSSFMAAEATYLTGQGVLQAKPQREVVPRALADSVQTRTWNLLIDVVAQVGRYTPNSRTLDDFLVEGEQRYWLSIALDRYTGEVIDQSLEPNND